MFAGYLAWRTRNAHVSRPGEIMPGPTLPDAALMAFADPQLPRQASARDLRVLAVHPGPRP